MGVINNKLSDLVTFFTRRKNSTRVYDSTRKTLDISKILDPNDIYRILNDSMTTGSYGSEIYNKFFDLNLGRADRYAEYEQMYYRIPEVAAALHIYTDLILSPNIGQAHNNLKYFPTNDSLGIKAETYAKTLLESTTVVDYMPKIIFNALFYGDCFVSSRKTNYGIQYTIHNTKETSILFDQTTGICLGIVVRLKRTTDSAIDRILSLACPTISLSVPKQTVGIIAGEVKDLKDYDYLTKIKEMEDMVTEVLANTTNDANAQFRYFPPGKYTTFSIHYNDFYYPYGTSILDPLRAVAKQLLLTEAALSIYRMTRAPLRYKFLVEVGSMPENKIRSMLNQIKDGIKKDRVISNSSNNSIDAIPDMLAPEEEFWIPTVGGTPFLDIVPLEGANLDPFIGDVDYFKKKLIAGLAIPPSYLAHEEGTSTRALLTLEDMRFTRTIKKYQSDINLGLTELNDNNFQLAGVPELIGHVKIQLPSPQTLEDSIRIENLNNRLSTSSDFLSQFPNVPKLWVMKNIVCMDQTEIDDMEKTIEEQKKYRIFSDQPAGELDSSGEIIESTSSNSLNSFGSESSFEDSGPDLDSMNNGDSDLETLDFEKSIEDLSSEISEGPSEGELSL